MPAQPTVAFGVDTDAVHLDSVNWFTFMDKSRDKLPSFGGRYFLGEPGTFLWGHGEGSMARNGTGDTLKRIAPIQASFKSRQETEGTDGYFYGTGDAFAMCNRLSTAIAMGEFDPIDPSQMLYVFLRVEEGTKLTSDYWAGWASCVNAGFTFTGGQMMTQPLLPCIQCSFHRSDGKYVLDDPVQKCLDQVSRAYPAKQTLCHGFWATPTDVPGTWTEPPASSLEAWEQFKWYQQPFPHLWGLIPDVYPVPVLLWRYAQLFVPLSTEVLNRNPDLEQDPHFPNGRLLGLDAPNPLVDPQTSNRPFDPQPHMLTVPDGWSMQPGRIDNQGNVDVGNVKSWGIDVNVSLNSGNLINDVKGLVIPAATVLSSNPKDTNVYPVYAASNQHPIFVVRYFKNTPARLLPDEAYALREAGLRIVTVAEYATPAQAEQPTFYTPAQGYKDALDAFTKAANEVGQPEHTPVYFAVDVSHGNLPVRQPIDPNIRHEWQYFHTEFVDGYLAGVMAGYSDYVKAQAGGVIPYEIGVYGQPEVLERAYQRGIASYYWMATQSTDSRPYRGYEVWEHANLLQRGNDYETTIGIPGGGHLKLDFDASWGDEGSR